MKLYYKYINLYSPFLYVATIEKTFVTYEYIHLEDASNIEKKKLSEINQFLSSFSSNNKNVNNE